MTPCDHNRLPRQGFIWKCQTERISRPGWMRQGTEPSSQTRRIHVMCWNQAANDLICKFASIIWASLFCLLVFVAMVLPSGLHSNSLPSQCQHEPSEFHWNVQQSAPHTQHHTSLHTHARSTTRRHLSVAWRTFHTHQATHSYTILHYPTPCCSSGWHWRHDSGNSTRGGTTGCNSDGCWLHDLHMFLDDMMSFWGFMGFMGFMGHWNFNKFHMS